MKQNIKLTNEDLSTLDAFIGSYMTDNTDMTQNHWRIENHTIEDVAPAIKKYNKLIDGLRVKHCLKGDKKEILLNAAGQRQWTEDGTAAFDEEAEMLAKTETEIEVTKVNWSDFSEDEQKWFRISNNRVRRIMGFFVDGVPEYKIEKPVPAESNHN